MNKKLIEVALPLKAINEASVRESYIYRGNPSAMHKWWAQRPLAAARAVIFAQMVDDPSSHPERFPTEEARDSERQRLFSLIEQLIIWENTANESLLAQAREEIWESWRITSAENRRSEVPKELFDPEKLPPFYDPFAGGGSLPLEAQRLGLESHASDLNPIAVLVSKAIVDIPRKFAGQSPVNSASRTDRRLTEREWKGAQGLAEDIRFYGGLIRADAEKRIGHLYPKIEVTREMAKGRRDLEPLVGCTLTVIAWLWVRTVKSPNPAFADVDVPLASTFILSTRAGKNAYVEPVTDGKGYHFKVRSGRSADKTATSGTKLSRGANFRCLMSGTPISEDHIRSEFRAKRADARLMAIVAESQRGRVYLSPTPEAEELARNAKPEWKPDVEMNQDSKDLLSGRGYGFKYWHELFTPRQLVALTTFSDLVLEIRERVKRDAMAAGLEKDNQSLANGGSGAQAYADAVATYTAFSLSKVADYNCSLVPWYTKEDRPGHLFSKQAIPMVWDYVELNPFSEIGGSLVASINIIAEALDGCSLNGDPGEVKQHDAVSLKTNSLAIFCTDPPYYDNIAYADLSDFFYVWLRHSLKSVFPDLFATLAVPKAEELVATPYRHGGKERAEAFFLAGMTEAMRRLAEQAHPAFPVTIFYAFKQSESESDSGTASTGWETFLDAVIRAGLAITGTWPIRTERGSRSVGIGTNSLASSIVLVCRPRLATSPTATRREFLSTLRAELPEALIHLQHGNIAPVDLAQAAIGPGMAVYTRYAKVLDAEGNRLSVREALTLINQTLDEVLTEQEGDFDVDSRWALAWFGDHGFESGPFGEAHTYFVRFNTAENALKHAGIIESGRGKVRLLKPSELLADWDPETDSRLTAWQSVHHLIRALEAGGESAAAELVAKLGGKAEIARELAYRLYTLCERKKRAQEALSYNGLVQSWPEIIRLAREGAKVGRTQAEMFAQE